MYCEAITIEWKKVTVTATTGKAAQALQEKLPKTLTARTVHKCLGLKDGRYTNAELADLLQNEEYMLKVKHSIASVDCLIIDEISMCSKKMIEQIQHVMNIIRGPLPFGGAQIILCGDFLQLPPIANPSYGDDGTYCFKSEYVKQCFHHVQLTEIHRQAEPDLIAAIHQITRYQYKLKGTFYSGNNHLTLKKRGAMFFQCRIFTPNK